jgi:hypothetical protein
MFTPAGVAAHRTGEKIRIKNNADNIIECAACDCGLKDKTDAAKARRPDAPMPLRPIARSPANRRRRAHAPAMMPEQRRRPATDMGKRFFTVTSST